MREWLDGEDEINPPIQFPPPEFGGPVVTFSSWSEVSGMCGDSRVWGGLHFEVNEESFACAQGLEFASWTVLPPPAAACLEQGCVRFPIYWNGVRALEFPLTLPADLILNFRYGEARLAIGCHGSYSSCDLKLLCYLKA